MSETSPLVKVARDLREIVTLSEALEVQAIAKATDRLMPGGLAMVALAGVASLEAWSENLEAAEHLALAGYRDTPAVEDEDDWEPPLQTLLFWSEAWRTEHGYPLPERPTIASEVNFIRWATEWAWDHEVHFADFASDMATARARLETLLYAGTRPVTRGAPCLYDECRGARLVRKTVPASDKKGNKIWRLTDWHCPKCKRSWDEDAYRRHIYAAIERSHFDDMGSDETWCTVSRAARRVDRPEGTIRSWISRGEISAACLIADGRELRTFVLLDDVVDRDTLARERHARWVAARVAKQTTAV